MDTLPRIDRRRWTRKKGFTLAGRAECAGVTGNWREYQPEFAHYAMMPPKPGKPTRQRGPDLQGCLRNKTLLGQAALYPFRCQPFETKRSGHEKTRDQFYQEATETNAVVVKPGGPSKVLKKGRGPHLQS